MCSSGDGKEGKEEFWFKDIEFECRKMKNLWRWSTDLSTRADVLNATECALGQNSKFMLSI